MVIGTAIVELRIPGANSLKDKRRVLKSMLDRTRARFNVSLAEVENQDNWRQATLGLACVTNDGSHAHQCLQAVLNFLERFPEAEVMDYSVEIL